MKNKLYKPTKKQPKTKYKSWDELVKLGKKLRATSKQRDRPLTYEEMSALDVLMQESIGDDIIKAFKNPDKQFGEMFDQEMREAEERRAKEKAVKGLQRENTQELYAKQKERAKKKKTGLNK